MFGIFKQRELIWTFARRELIGRYRGSILGISWSFLNPLFLLGIYTLVFSVLLKVRFSNSSDPAVYALFLFCGLIPWIAFSEVINKAPQVIRANLNLAKKTIFPLEILVVSSTLTSWFHSLFGLGILLVAAWILGIELFYTTIPLIVIIMIPQIFLTLGLGWFLASLGVFIRDTGEITQLALRIGMYLTPIIYPIDIIPEAYRGWFLLNPMATIVEAYRDVLLRGTLPNLILLASVVGIGIGFSLLGYLWFMRSKKVFAEVI